MRKQSFEPELTVESFVGWRVWAVTLGETWEADSEPVLRGAWGQAWPDPELKASCLHRPIRSRAFLPLLKRREKAVHATPAPDPACSCGIYARRANQPDDLWVSQIAHLPLAGGFIEMSGTVIEGSKGYRAERARIVGPLEVWVHCSECGEPASYVATNDRRFRGSCHRHAAGGASTREVADWMEYVIPSLGHRYQVPIMAAKGGDPIGHR